MVLVLGLGGGGGCSFILLFKVGRIVKKLFLEFWESNGRMFGNIIYKGEDRKYN